MSRVEKVYAGLSQTELDAEYNNRAKVADAASHLQWFAAAAKTCRAQVACVLDVAYGESPGERLDLFFLGDNGRKRALHVFFHGGYWHALDKNDFSFVANAFQGADAICAVANYALMPAVGMDELVAQCRRALAWLWRNADEYGGDRARMTVSGHSAGGHLVAMLMASDWRALGDCPRDVIKGGVALSGLFDLQPIRLSYLNQTLRLDDACAHRNSPIHLRNQSGANLMCYVGELEGREYLRQSRDLAARWQTAETIVLPKQNHFTIMREMARADSRIAEQLRKQLYA